MILFISCLLSILCVKLSVAADGSKFGYGKTDGPKHWRGDCAVGTRQSPIDIRLSEVDYSMLHRLHLLHYDHSDPVEIKNTGKTVQVSGFDQWEDGRKQPIMRGGGLKHTYKLHSLHFHWGHTHHTGSEHTLNGLHYPAEMHLVHVREGMDLKQALETEDGIAVLGVWIVEGDNDSNFALISDTFHYIQHEGNATALPRFYTRHLLPERTGSFYRYEGSLTTPGCNEAVVWTILADPLSVSAEQLRRLRSLQDSHGTVLHANYRPVHPLNGRSVLFRPHDFNTKLLCSASNNLFDILNFLIVTFVLFKFIY